MNIEQRIKKLEEQIGVNFLNESTLEIGGQAGQNLWDEIITPLYEL